jgi:hypothetical protein
MPWKGREISLTDELKLKAVSTCVKRFEQVQESLEVGLDIRMWSDGLTFEVCAVAHPY